MVSSTAGNLTVTSPPLYTPPLTQLTTYTKLLVRLVMLKRTGFILKAKAADSNKAGNIEITAENTLKCKEHTAQSRNMEGKLTCCLIADNNF